MTTTTDTASSSHPPVRNHTPTSKDPLHLTKFRSAATLNDGNVSEKANITNPPLIFAPVVINNLKVHALFDTGATTTIIKEDILRKTKHFKFISSDTKQTLSLADSVASLNVIGIVELQIKLHNLRTTIVAAVVKDLFTDCIIGVDYIRKHNLQFDFANDIIMTTCGNFKVTIPIETQQNVIKVPLRLTESVKIPPKEEIIIRVSACISTASTLFRPSHNLGAQIPIIMANNLLQITDHRAVLTIYNPSEYPCMLSRGVIMGVSTLPVQQQSVPAEPQNLSPEEHIEQLINKIEDRHMHSDVNGESDRDTFRKMLLKFKHLFGTNKISVAKTEVVHAINTEAHSPPSSHFYPISPKKEQAMYDILQELLKAGLISKTKSEYASPALLTPKSDGSWRLVIDYKKLNHVTIKDQYPLPNMEQTIQRLGEG
ncbi:unnamed protein product [Didymodactylos carnosus]|uniref:Peptidase A2 domain-containing protein n=1 Tax=Didymodactylos carnosus TaxID=1234261 RepID=A0A814PN67_9BILA|nr:unnamed protein product [Didymodactylos carnosus]CAF3872781.1 unnamed protein product [Didymodactylos carnosus]